MIPLITIHETITDSGFFKRVNIYIEIEIPIPVTMGLMLYKNVNFVLR